MRYNNGMKRTQKYFARVTQKGPGFVVEIGRIGQQPFGHVGCGAGAFGAGSGIAVYATRELALRLGTAHLPRKFYQIEAGRK